MEHVLAVAVRVVMVRPWKELWRVMIVARPWPYLSKEYFRAVLIMPSLASAPELQKNTLSANVRSQRALATFTIGAV